MRLNRQAGKMAFADHEYRSWKPNKSFIRYFEDMKKRRIAASEGISARVTDTPPPGESSRSQQTNHAKRNQGNGYMPAASETLVRTAVAQTGYKRKRAKRDAVKQPKKRQGKTSLEPRLKKAKL